MNTYLFETLLWTIKKNFNNIWIENKCKLSYIYDVKFYTYIHMWDIYIFMSIYTRTFIYLYVIMYACRNTFTFPTSLYGNNSTDNFFKHFFLCSVQSCFWHWEELFMCKHLNICKHLNGYVLCTQVLIYINISIYVYIHPNILHVHIFSSVLSNLAFDI
jgi:hypothetical protein